MTSAHRRRLVPALIASLGAVADASCQVSLAPLRTLNPPSMGASIWAATVFLDLDGDGAPERIEFPDQLLGPMSVVDLQALANDGDGGFATQGTSLGRGVPGELVAVDLDGDGDLDLLSSAGDGFFNQAGAFTRRPVLAAPPRFSMAVGDFDGDGDADAYFLRWPAHVLWANDGTGSFSDNSAVLPPVSFFTRPVVFDANGDGVDDIALHGAGFGSLSTPAVHLWLGQTRGPWVDVTAGMPPVVGDVEAIAAGDVDGDGDFDLAVQDERTAAIWTNDGSGRFTVAAGIPPMPSVARAFEFVDLDGDSDLDLVAGLDGLLDRPSVFANDGRGVFVSRISDLRPGTVRRITTSDVDRDGDQDLLLTSFGPSALRLAINDGTGHLFEPEPLPHLLFPLDVAFGEWSGDPFPDVVALQSAGNTAAISVLANRGDGSFAESNRLTVDAGAERVLAFDMDGDGRDDLVALAQTGMEIRWGASAGTLPAVGPLGGLYGVTVTAGDFDGDGLMDVAIRDQVLFGNPGRSTTFRAIGQVNGVVEATWAADLDLDGDADAVALIGNSLRCLTNTHRQLARLAPIRSGRTARLAIWGDPGQPAVLAAAFQRLPVPAPLGDWLDPASVTLLGAGRLDGNGRATLAVPVPTVVGASPTIYAQAVLLGPAGLEATNLEVLDLQLW